MKFFIHRIKKIALSQLVILAILNIVLINLVLITPAAVLAQLPGETPPGESTKLTNPLKSADISALIKEIAKLAAKIGIPIAAIFIIYSGLLFVTARGSEEQLNKAKKNFMWAMIGTAILLGAWAIAEAIDATIKAL